MDLQVGEYVIPEDPLTPKSYGEFPESAHEGTLPCVCMHVFVCVCMYVCMYLVLG
jgi:hypothetical protein